MRVRELIEYLEEFDGDMEVKIAYQPNYPMQASIDDVKEADGKIYVIQINNGNDYAPEEIYED